MRSTPGNLLAILLKVPMIPLLSTVLTMNSTGLRASDSKPFHSRPIASTPVRKAGTTWSLMNPPSADRTGLMTLFHADRMTPEMPCHAGAMTLRHSQVNTGASTAFTKIWISPNTTLISDQATWMASRIPAHTGLITLLYSHVNTGPSTFDTNHDSAANAGLMMLFQANDTAAEMPWNAGTSTLRHSHTAAGASTLTKKSASAVNVGLSTLFHSQIAAVATALTTVSTTVRNPVQCVYA